MLTCPVAAQRLEAVGRREAKVRESDGGEDPLKPHARPRLAAELGEDPDLLLAMAGKVSSDLKGIILRRPRLFADLLRELKDAPDHAILRVVREVRDGDW